MVDRAGAESDRVAAEVVASLCLATDLGMGFPFEHGLEATLMTMRLADLLQVDSDTAMDTFYASLLMYVGCTTDADVSSRIFPGGLTVHMTPVEYGSSREGLAAVMRAVTPPDLSIGMRLYEREGFPGPHGSASRTMRHCVRWRRCWRPGLASPPRSVVCAAVSLNGGMATGSCAGPPGRRYPFLFGSLGWHATLPTSVYSTTQSMWRR